MKSILIIDTPKTCYECPLRVMESDLYYTYFACQNDSCITNESLELTKLEMNCPLKPLPKIPPHIEFDEYCGYEQCLKDILGG